MSYFYENLGYLRGHGNLNTSIPCDSVINIPRYNRYMSLINLKKRLMIPKGKSESVYRRTDNTMAIRKCTKVQKTMYKHTYKTKDRVTRSPLRTGGELRCSGRVSSSCLTSGTRRVNQDQDFHRNKTASLSC